jgi:type 1 fimbria pilin
VKTFIRLAITFSLPMFISPWVVAQGAAQGDGVVTLGGEVVDSACGLELVSVDQTIDMDPEPIGRFLRRARGGDRSFELRLVNCTLSRTDPSRPGVTLPDWQHLRVTFDGLTDRGGRSFAVFGGSQGVALNIEDSIGQLSVPGQPMTPHPLMEGDITLHYTLHFVGNGLPIVAGGHRAAVRFKLEYF